MKNKLCEISVMSTVNVVEIRFIIAYLPRIPVRHITYQSYRLKHLLGC